MELGRLNRRLNSVIFPLCRIPNVFGVHIILIIMFATIIDVILRFSLNKSLLGLYEVIQFLMVVVVSLGIGYTQTEKSHVNIVFVTDRLPSGIKKFIECFNLLASVVFFWFMVVAGIIQVMQEYTKEGMSPVLEIPTYPFYAIIVVGSVIMLLALLRDLLAVAGNE